MFKQRTRSLEGLVDVIAMNHRSHHDIIYAVYSLLFYVSYIRQNGFCGRNSYYKSLSEISFALPFSNTH